MNMKNYCIPPYPNMNMTRSEYAKFFIHSKEYSQRRMNKMCKPVSNIRGFTAEELLRYCEQEDNIPVDLSVMLKKLDISAIPMDFSSLEKSVNMQEKVSKKGYILGALISRGDSAAIFYKEDDAHHEHRYRFTIAHELAHCCLTGSENHIEFRFDGESYDENERAANIFAGELLIPEKHFYRVLDQLLLPSVDVLADIFSVSKNVMDARIKYLKPTAHIVGYNC